MVLGNLKIGIRANNLKTKAVDLYMTVSCILWKQYDQEDQTPTGMVIDIGAHIGSFSVYAGRFAERVISFEPDPANYKRLLRNIELNGCTNVVPVNKGVAGSSGSKILFENKSNSAGHSMLHKSDGLGKTVPCLDLKDIFESENISVCNLMKLDCEGAEFDILMNTPQNIIEKIKLISMEYHRGYDLSKLLNFLTKSGFEIIKNERENYYQGMIWAKR